MNVIKGGGFFFGGSQFLGLYWVAEEMSRAKGFNGLRNRLIPQALAKGVEAKRILPLSA